MMRYDLGQANRIGSRDSNQDRFAAITTDEGVLLVMADGMGGHAGGAIAAQTLVETARKFYFKHDRPVRDVAGFLEELMVKAHHNILRAAARNHMEVLPGTTGVLCLVQDGYAYWAHVGDSRLYLFRDQLPIYRTQDHSYVERLFREGVISRVEMDSHPMRNHITQCLGCREKEPEVSHSKPTPLERGDILLLCTDGLWGPLDDAQMGTMLANRGTLDENVAHMAETAEQYSYPRSDNVSVLALRYHGWDGAAPPPPPGALPHRRPAPNTGNTGQERDVRSAIEQIEQILREYEDEMKR